MNPLSLRSLNVSTLPDQEQELSFWKSVQAQFRSWLLVNLWPVLGLLTVTILVYAPVVNFGFLNWDDTWYIVRNDLIKSWNPVNLYRIATEPVARNFAPLTIGTFLVEHTLWGLWPGGYHLTNVFLHAINAVLVFQEQARSLGDRCPLCIAPAASRNGCLGLLAENITLDHLHAGKLDLLAENRTDIQTGRLGDPLAAAGTVE